MQIIKTARNAALAAVALVASSGAFAAVSTEVTTALTDAKADVATVGGAVLIVIVAAAAFKYMRRAL
jgi:hypothetical protein